MTETPDAASYLKEEAEKNALLMEVVYPELLLWIKYVASEGARDYKTPGFIAFMVSQKINELQNGFNLVEADKEVTTNIQDVFDQPYPSLWDNKTASEYFTKIYGIIGSGCPCSVSMIFDFLSQKAINQLFPRTTKPVTTSPSTS